MKKKLWLYTTCMLVLANFALVIQPSRAQDKLVQFNQQISEINSILQDNPEIVPELLTSLKSFLESKQKSQQAFKKYHAWLFDNDAVHPWVGAQQPELTIVVFTDYDCPYCKRLDPHLRKLAEEFPQVKIVSVLVPIRQHEVRGSAVSPSDYGLSVWRSQRNKYAEVEGLLYRKNGLHDAGSLRQIAQRTQTQNELKKKSGVQDTIAENYRAFSELGLRGTPAIMIGEGVIPGYVEYEQLASVVRSHL